MIYLGVDVGILNLALVKCKVENYNLVTILDARCVNLNELTHERVPLNQCTLEHSNDVYDKLQHLFQEYPDLFSNVDQVRIERQPIGGLVHVEQLMFGHFRSKAKLISPNSMHKYFEIQQYDYDGRKIQTTRIAEPYLSHMTGWQRERVHDLADALCIVLFSLSVEKKESDARILAIEQKQRQLQRQQDNFELYGDPAPLQTFFDQFRYNSDTSRHSTSIISAKEWLHEKPERID